MSNDLLQAELVVGGGAKAPTGLMAVRSQNWYGCASLIEMESRPAPLAVAWEALQRARAAAVDSFTILAAH